jgi:drug/metabolite transporter (DMT)-like permease
MKSRAALYLAILGLIWGTSFLFIKICVGSIPLFTFVAGRMLMGGCILYCVLLLQGDKMPPLGRAWTAFAFIGFFNALVPYGLIAWGEQYISSGLAAILNATTPIFTVILAHYLISDERLTASRITGILLGFAGVVVIVWPELGRGTSFDLWGQLAVVGGSLSYAVAIVYARNHLKGMPAIKTSIGMLASGFVMTVPLILLLEDPLEMQPTPQAWLSWVALGVFGTAVAYLLYYWLVRHAGATYTSLVTFLLPPMGVFWGAVILGERIVWVQAVGALVILFSIMLVNGYLDKPWRRLTSSLRSA